MSCPDTNTCPVVGRSRPPRICSKVVLPEPDAPTIAIRSPDAAAKLTPRSTSRFTGPCVKFFWTSRASNTNSLMSQGLGGGGTRSAPRGINSRHRTQQEGDRADPHHVHPFHVARQLTHVINARVQEVRVQQPFQPLNQ